MIHELFYDEENEIVVLKLNNDYMFNEVTPVLSGIKELLEGKQYKQVLVMMHEKYKIENREAREAMSKGIADMDVSQVAFVGLSSATRMITRVILKTGLVKINGDFFKTREEAIEWLKSKRK